MTTRIYRQAKLGSLQQRMLSLTLMDGRRVRFRSRYCADEVALVGYWWELLSSARHATLRDDSGEETSFACSEVTAVDVEAVEPRPPADSSMPTARWFYPSQDVRAD